MNKKYVKRAFQWCVASRMSYHPHGDTPVTSWYSLCPLHQDAIEKVGEASLLLPTVHEQNLPCCIQYEVRSLLQV